MQAVALPLNHTPRPKSADLASVWRDLLPLYVVGTRWSGEAASSLGSATLLSLPSGRKVAASPQTSHSHQATCYPTAGEATVMRRSGSAGRQFRRVTRANGETLRVWQLHQLAAERKARQDEQGLAEALLSESSELEPDRARSWLRYERGRRAENRAIWREESTCRSREVANRRAVAKVRRYARSNRLDHLCTLTFSGEGVHTRSQLVAIWNTFLKRFQVAVGHHAILAVPEPHPEGHGFHIHLGIAGKVDIPALRRCWQWGYGYGVDVAFFGGNGLRAKGHAPKRVAKYLAKYLTKDLDTEAWEAAGITEARKPGEHRYWVAQGVAPLVVRLYAYGRDPLHDALVGVMGGLPQVAWCSDTCRDWQGPRVEWFDFWPDPPGRKLPLDTRRGPTAN